MEIQLNEVLLSMLLGALMVGSYSLSSIASDVSWWTKRQKKLDEGRKTLEEANKTIKLWP